MPVMRFCRGGINRRHRGNARRSTDMFTGRASVAVGARHLLSLMPAHNSVRGRMNETMNCPVCRETFCAKQDMSLGIYSGNEYDCARCGTHSCFVIIIFYVIHHYPLEGFDGRRCWPISRTAVNWRPGWERGRLRRRSCLRRARPCAFRRSAHGEIGFTDILVLPAFRLTAFSWAAAKYPVHQTKFGAAAAAAYAAAAAVSATVSVALATADAAAIRADYNASIRDAYAAVAADSAAAATHARAADAYAAVAAARAAAAAARAAGPYAGARTYAAAYAAAKTPFTPPRTLTPAPTPSTLPPPTPPTAPAAPPTLATPPPPLFGPRFPPMRRVWRKARQFPPSRVRRCGRTALRTSSNPCAGDESCAPGREAGLAGLDILVPRPFRWPRLGPDMRTRLCAHRGSPMGPMPGNPPRRDRTADRNECARGPSSGPHL